MAGFLLKCCSCQSVFLPYGHWGVSSIMRARGGVSLGWKRGRRLRWDRGNTSSTHAEGRITAFMMPWRDTLWRPQDWIRWLCVPSISCRGNLAIRPLQKKDHQNPSQKTLLPYKLILYMRLSLNEDHLLAVPWVVLIVDFYRNLCFT